MTADLFPIDIAEIIVKQVPQSSVADMDWLLEVWKEYVEPDLSYGCGKCRERIFENFRNLQGALILRIQQSRLLDEC